MPIVSFVLNGNPSYGVVRDDQVLDLRGAFPLMPPTLGAAMRTGLMEHIKSAEFLQAGNSYPLGPLTLLPPAPDPDKIICIGRNYAAHVAEGGHAVAPNPSIFIRPTNTLMPHNGALQRPTVSHQLDFEGELALVEDEASSLTINQKIE